MTHLQGHGVPGGLQDPDSLVVSGVAKVAAVDADDGVADKQLSGLVGGLAFEDLADDDGHPVFPPSFDGDAQRLARHLADVDCPGFVRRRRR